MFSTPSLFIIIIIIIIVVVVVVIIIITIIIFIQDSPISVISTGIKGVLLLKYIKEKIKYKKSLKGIKL